VVSGLLIRSKTIMTQAKTIAVLIGSLLATSATANAGVSPKGVEFFESKIRPVLSKYCYECHSAQAKKLKASLYLDSKDGMLKGGDSGPVFVPGKAKGSLLIKALEHDGTTKMPSQSTKLPKEIIDDFVKWIDMGAPDPREGKVASKARSIDIEKGREHWAFQPLMKANVPAVKNADWGRTPVDRFILAKLEEKGLTPNGPIERERLLRRAYFDLHGLPPTPAEIEAFLKDSNAKPQAAYQKVIDKLLESPRFGERWARHWLDVVRFAESGGYEFDGNRPAAFHYRDFVIRAFNQDMPFDQFIRWQIAGDHLVPGNMEAIAATGFLVAGSYPGQTTAKTLALIRYDHLDDMISTLGTSMLGLSIGCARCHEHKYDPIPQEDYYRLIAALGRTDSANVKVNADPETYRVAKAAYDKEHAPLVKTRDDFEKNELPKRMKEWWQAHKDQATTHWLYLDAIDAKGKNPLQKQPDAAVLATGKPEKNETYTIVAHTMQKKIKAIRIEALADKSLPKMGPGRGPDGNFVLSEVSVQAAPFVPPPGAKPVPVKLRAAKASVEPDKFALPATLDNDKKTGWSIGALAGKDHAAVFEFDGDVGYEGGTILTVTLKFEADNFAMGKPRLGITTAPHPAKLDGTADHQHAAELLTVLGAMKELTALQLRSAVRWMRRVDPQISSVYLAVEKHAKSEPKANLVDVFAATSNKGGDVHFLIRGEVEKKKEIAKPGFAQVLMHRPDANWYASPLPSVNADPGMRSPSSEPRVGLANWMVDDKHGAGQLLARVIVNRLWQHHMGRGIVGTPNDFGAQGDAPTHPELLDYLASELIKNGWQLKPIHKLIMTSAAYTQSNEVNPASLKIDPQNRLWWRHPTRRLEAEAIRDNVLAVAGTLDLKMYGSGSLDGNVPRRSVYLTVKRSQMVPLLQMFDVPEALQSIGERSVTTVPTQSLAFMNSPFVRGAAQKLAVRVRAKTDGESVEQAYLFALGRHPTDGERERMRSFIEQQTESYGKSPQAREQAVVDFCQVLLCLNEFIYID
jgi:hypothetical protein